MPGVLRLMFLAVILEALRLAWFTRFPLYPDFLLGLTVIIALTRRPPAGAAAGLFLGLFRDFLYGPPLGTEAIPFALVGWMVGSMGRTLYRDSALTQGLAMIAGGLGRGIIVYLLMTEGDLPGMGGHLLREVAPASLVTAIVVPIIYHLGQRMTRHGIRIHGKTILFKR
jgi:rod shape-determining protein MreD